jgi:DNA-directed RNA polymerase subunit beta
MPKKISYAIKDDQIQEVDDDEVDYELVSPSNFFSTHINLIPLQSSVQGPRLFYGARFYNQALPVQGAQAPWVQNLDPSDPEGRSFDDILGKYAGALYSDDDGEVLDVSNDTIRIKTPDGAKKEIGLYHNFPYNRKSASTQTPSVKKGDTITKGQLLARSNFTDEKGTLALGLNARVGLVPFKGYSFEDAVVVSNSFANRLKSDHSYTVGQDFDQDTKGGLNHYKSLFPTSFKKSQFEHMDEDGVILPGTVVNTGDPLVLATRPRVFSSTTSQLGKLSKAMRQSRHDASQIWEEEHEGIVTDVAKTRKGVKVQIQTFVPTHEGDKVVLRSGQKGVISKIIPDDQMPRTLDGKPLEVLLNPLGIPSRANNSLVYELLLGKAAEAKGAPIKVSGFNKPGEKWYDFVRQTLGEVGLPETEEVFDPVTNKKLGQPVTVGNAYILKLHHTSASKSSARGQGGYTADQQPLKGSGESGGSKRLSGLEVHSMLSSGAYANIKEGSTLRGQSNDEFWRALRSGQTPKPPGKPFVWDKFQALLTGAGMHARDIGEGKLRLGPFTDDDLEKRKPMEIENGELVDINTLEPKAGGLFDQALVGNNKWGKISLPFAVPNPAFESSIRHLLGLTEKDLRAILAGEMELPPHLR